MNFETKIKKLEELVKKLETPRKVSVVTLLLTNARDKEIKSKADLIESEEFASQVIVSGDGSSFRGSDQSIVEKSGMLDYNSEFQSFYLEGLKDLSSDSMSHKLHLTVQHNSKTKRNYNSANLSKDFYMPIRSAEPKKGVRKRISKTSNKIETGRVEKGSTSKQKIETVDMEFETYAFHTVSYKMLPSSQKNITSEELVEKYCVNCGKKNKPNNKFCPNCGTKR